ncbi:VOC family protein [Shouchella sp. 1P09AA]|uniref:VOC family protein n=1 Tax=unclassified Shouchella TaxID=2893065 RepID=UPI0039A26BA2
MIKGLYEAHLPVSNLKESIMFYQKLELELAHQQEGIAFMWIEKGKSWLGLWETEAVNTPYHPSIRHVAFYIHQERMNDAKEWLNKKGIDVSTNFGFSADTQPLVLPNNPQAHAAIYFQDLDGNSIEFITPLRLDFDEEFHMQTLEEWHQKG